VRILALTPYIPNPPHGGGEQRLHHVLMALAEAGQLDVWCLPRSRDQLVDWALAERFVAPPRYFARSEFQSKLVPEELRRSRLWPRRTRSDFSSDLWKALADHDLDCYKWIHVESLGLVPIALALKDRYPNVHVSLGMDNIDPIYAFRNWSVTWRNLSVRSNYWSLRNVIDLFRLTRFALPILDEAWVCSNWEAAWINRWTRVRSVRVVPNGVELHCGSDLVRDPVSGRVVLTGTLSEGPNSDGAVWFVSEIWPRVRAQCPNAELHLIGKDPCPAVLELGSVPGVVVVGPIPDIRQELMRASVAIVSVRFGTGTRLKILEAAACGVPVVSTSIGAEGLAFTPGRDYLLADRASDFAKACIRLLEDSALSHTIGEAGRVAVQQYDWKLIRQQIADLIPKPKQVEMSRSE
jgi:polysaccharide biosynthesis protein PslH